MLLFNLTMIMSSFISLVLCSSPLVKEVFLTFDYLILSLVLVSLSLVFVHVMF